MTASKQTKDDRDFDKRVLRAAVLLVVLLVIGGLVGPAVTRALNRPTRPRR